MLNLIERGKYSDYDGKVDMDFKKFILPLSDEEYQWIWEADWNFEVIPEQTDNEGWVYAYDFAGPFHVENHKLDCVRKRRWIRTCIKVKKSSLMNSPKQEIKESVN